MLPPSSGTGLSPSAVRLSRRFPSSDSCNIAVLQPRPHLDGDGLGFSPVARRYWGNHVCFLFLRVLRCFSSPGSPPALAGWQSVRLPGCPIRISMSHCLLAARHGFSQLAASFVAFQSPGIRRAPLIPFAARRGTGPRAHTLDSTFVFSYLFVQSTCMLSSACTGGVNPPGSLLLFQHVNERAGRAPRKVENNGFEPLTPCLQSRCSSQLS